MKKPRNNKPSTSIIREQNINYCCPHVELYITKLNSTLRLKKLYNARKIL